MGFMDKAKEAALQAKASAEKVAHQGQAKVAEMQQTRTEGELYRTLGEAFYNEQRRGGDKEAVTAALTALDQHFASAAASPASGATPGATPGQAAPAAPTAGDGPAAPSGGTPPSGNFTFDNL